jgi:hypothetical protein
MKMKLLFILVFLSLIVGLSSVSFATDIPVTGNSFTDIQFAVSSAGTGDAVKLQNQTYNSAGSEITVSNDNIVIEGTNGIATVNGNGNRISM